MTSKQEKKKKKKKKERKEKNKQSKTDPESNIKMFLIKLFQKVER